MPYCLVVLSLLFFLSSTLPSIAGSNIIVTHSGSPSSSLTIGNGEPSLFFIQSVPTVSIVGDVNQDGSVNAVDITKLERVIVGLDQSSNADVNLDGMVNALDITKLERIIGGIDK